MPPLAKDRGDLPVREVVEELVDQRDVFTPPQSGIGPLPEAAVRGAVDLERSRQKPAMAPTCQHVHNRVNAARAGGGAVPPPYANRGIGGICGSTIAHSASGTSWPNGGSPMAAEYCRDQSPTT